MRKSPANSFKRNARKIDFIQAHLSRNFKRWFNKYSGLEGVNIGIKKVKGKEKAGCYSVIFHGNKKNKRARKKVPKFLPVRVSGKVERIPTDVIEAGALHLHGIKIGDQTSNDNSTVVGTVSCYFSGSNGTSLCSNMHVLGANLLDTGQLEFDANAGDAPQSVHFSDAFIS